MVSDQRFFTHTVIGSGPAGWASLNALIEQGIKPLLIDIGQTSNSPNYFTSPGTKSSSAVAQKTRFGSDHMYTYPAAEDLNFNIEGTVPLSSARGGLSTVWGSNIQGYSWPAQFSDHNIGFENALNAVISQIPTTGCKDTLENVYNWPENFKDRTTLSNRSINIQSRFAKDDTWVLGEARNATLGFRTGCTRCGLCLTGCPENAIFSTESSIRQLINSRTIDYLEAQVTKISNIDGNWKIELLFFNPGQEVHVYSEKVYLGAGAIASSIILSRSELIPENATLDDTQVIYLPFVSFRDRAESQTTFSLAQLFLETKCGMFQENSLHVSIYEHSDSFRDRAANIFPRLAPLLPSFVFKRLMAGIAFLPTNQSGKVGILRSNENVSVSLISNPRQKKLVKSNITRLIRPLLKMGLVPFSLFASFGNVGASYHVGNLCSDNKSLIDFQGSILNAPNLFIIDGSSLPILPAGPITLGIMANSRKITVESLRN